MTCMNFPSSERLKRSLPLPSCQMFCWLSYQTTCMVVENTSFSCGMWVMKRKLVFTRFCSVPLPAGMRRI